MRPGSTYVSPWTEPRFEQLKRDWANGISASTIAQRLGGGITRNAVIGKVNRMGLDHRKNSHVLYTPKPERKRAERQIRRNGTGYVPLAPEDQAPAPNLESLQEVEAQSKPQTFLGIPLLDLEYKHCRYPREIDGVFLFCGQPKFTRVLSDGTMIHSSYCRECHRRCHTGSFGKRSSFIASWRAA